jgi:hypothetical protein
MIGMIIHPIPFLINWTLSYSMTSNYSPIGSSEPYGLTGLTGSSGWICLRNLIQRSLCLDFGFGSQKPYVSIRLRL